MAKYKVVIGNQYKVDVICCKQRTHDDYFGFASATYPDESILSDWADLNLARKIFV